MNFPLRAMLSLLPLVCCMTISAPASAQIDGYPCNGSPGERQVGVAPPLGTPICVKGAGSQGATQSGAPVPDTMSAVANLYALEAKERAEKISRLLADPKFKKLQEGYWFYIEPNKDGAPATLPCMAKFIQLRGMVSVVALGGADEAIGGSVEGPDVPKPKKNREIEVTASKNGGSPITFKVMNSYNEGDVFGSLMFLSGNNLKEAMTKSWEQEGEVKFDFEGKTIFEGGYKKGSEMKKRFATCVQQIKK